MIINCPKCGFSQPKDRYCANCGVDMDTFRPKEAPLSSRILKSWIFQAVILLIAIVTALSFLKVQHQREAEEEIAKEINAPPPPPKVGENRAQAPAPPPLPPSQVARNISPPPPAATPAPSSAAGVHVATRSLGPNQVAAAGARPAAAPRAAAEANFSQIDLVYAEIPRTVLSNLEAGSRMLDADGVGAGVYPNIAPLMRQISATQRVRSFRILESARSLAVRINQPIVTFKGMRDPRIDRNIGITTQIIPTAMDENGLHVQVEIQRAVRDTTTANGLAEFSYQADMTLTKGSGAFIAGLLPRRQLDASDRSLYANAGVLKVLASQDFQEEVSEFVLFIEAR